jgi:catechol 2,3-dioxygenase-like lactoylglutathione lyase family enzyme
MVDDVEESIAFYTELLDFEVLTNFAPAFADVKRGNLRLLLAGPKSSAGRPMPEVAQLREPLRHAYENEWLPAYQAQPRWEAT